MTALSNHRTKLAAAHGVARALMDAGYSPEGVKLAFVQQGVPEKEAAEMTKEAVLGLGSIVAGLGKIAPTLIRGLSGAGRGLARSGAAAMRAGAQPNASMVQRAGGLLGRAGVQAGRGLRQSGMAVQSQGLPRALRGGAQNFGKGLLFGGGKGMGGALGKGMFAASTINTVGGMMGGQQTPQFPSGPYGGAFNRPTYNQ